MSGPIVRKYGFPNFEKIFGQRDLEHGVEEEPAEAEGTNADEAARSKAPDAAPDAARSAKPKPADRR
jgi:hypothetical protein